MTTTMLIAQLLLPVFAAVALSLLINPKHFKQIAKNFAENPALLYIVSVINLIGGTAILMYHNIWTADWSVAITIIGWLSFIKGLLHIIFPKFAQNTLNRAAKKNMVYFAMTLTIILTVILFSLSGMQTMTSTGM